MNPVAPRLEFLSRASIRVDRPLLIGHTPIGERRIVPILGGSFEGRLNAEVIPGGADWQILTSEGTAFLEARYSIRTAEGALIYVRNNGLRHGPRDVMALLTGSEPVDPALYYFRSAATFETGDPRLAWLNKIVVVGSGMRSAEAVVLDFYEVL